MTVALGRPRRARLAAAGLTAGLAAWMAVGTAIAFDPDRHAAAARAVVTASDVVTHTLGLEPAGLGTGMRARLEFRPGHHLSVVTLEGLRPLGGDQRYLVFLHNREGWSLAGTVLPDPDGQAQVRFGAEPRPATVYEVVVTAGRDNAASAPHGTPLMHWMDPLAIQAGAKRFDYRPPDGLEPVRPGP